MQQSISYGQTKKTQNRAASEESDALEVIEAAFREQDAGSNHGVKRGEDIYGGKEKDQNEYSLYPTSDGLLQDPRGWCWESEKSYLESEPWHPTWRTVRNL